MHILLTDRLTCPRCGPEWGLILLARDVRDRRILEGEFGCPSCEDRFPVREGFGDLRTPPRDDLSAGDAALDPIGGSGAGPDEEHLKLGALLGVTSGPGMVLVLGQRAEYAPALADLLEDVEIVAAHPGQVGERETPGVSRLAVGPTLPFRSHGFQGVLLADAPTPADLREGTRMAAPMGRVVAFRASQADRDLMEQLGFRIILWQEGVLVGERERL